MSENVLHTILAAPVAREQVGLRRALFLTVIALVTAGLIGLAVVVLHAGGWTPLTLALLVCFALNAPWLALGLATAGVGLAIRLTARDPVTAVLPALRSLRPGTPLLKSVACAVCVRNEAIGPIADRLARLIEAADAADVGNRFVACVLSDTSRDDIAAEEEAAMETLSDRIGADRVRYRRRAVNTGWKAGNVMDFLDRHAADLDIMLCLDADSDMDLPAVLRLILLMQQDPRLGIVQAIIAGTPARVAFPRLFQFGHRAGSRIWATGQAWWQGDQGPYWGHNAALRIAAFRADARLRPLANGTPIMSHDHVEAAQLQGAGWKVRVVPDETGSRETHPTNLPDFLRRDVRWAAGNMQYGQLLRRRELSVIGRLQMAQAILHYALTPAWFGMLPLAALIAMTGGAAAMTWVGIVVLLAAGMFALHSPKLFGYAETLLDPMLAAEYGGRRRYLLGALAEMLFTQVFDPLIALQKTIIMVRRRRGGWGAQNRDEQRVTWRTAARLFWPHTLAGVALTAAFGWVSAAALLVALPCLLGLLLAIPFATLTTSPALSRALCRRGLCAVPEELANIPPTYDAVVPAPMAMTSRVTETV